MYVKNTNFVLYLVLAAVVGIGAGCIFSSQDIQSKFTKGDISKANVYSNQKEDPSVTVIEEKLKTDESFLYNTKSAMSVLKERMTALSDLSERTLNTCQGIEELEGSLSNIASLNAKSFNTCNAIDEASAGLEQIVAGRKSPKYEQASNVAFIGFMKVERQISAGKEFVEEASEYLAKENAKKTDEITGLVAEWSVYCTQDAVLTASKDELKYWQGKVGELSQSCLANAGSDAWFNNSEGFGDFCKAVSVTDVDLMKAGPDFAESIFFNANASWAIAVGKLAAGANQEQMIRNQEGEGFLKNGDDMETLKNGDDMGFLGAVSPMETVLQAALPFEEGFLGLAAGGAEVFLFNNSSEGNFEK